MEYGDKIPKPRANHGAVIHNNNMYVFGGIRYNFKLNDFWKFEIDNNRW